MDFGLLHHLFVRNGSGAQVGVLLFHPLQHFHHPRMALVDLLVAGEPEVLVDPEGNAGDARFVRDADRNRAFEHLVGVEYVVDFFRFQNAVGMDAGRGFIELLADQRIHRRNGIADFLLEVAGNISDGGGVHTVVIAAEQDVFHHQSFHRRVAGAFTVTEQGSVGSRTTIEPGRARVD